MIYYVKDMALLIIGKSSRKQTDHFHTNVSTSCNH